MINNFKFNYKTNFEIKILFFLITFFYYLVPISVMLFDQQKNFFTSQSKIFFIMDDLHFSIGFVFLILFNFILFMSIFVFVTNILYKKNIFEQKDHLNLKIFNLLIKILLIIISVFIIFDLIKLILFIVEYTKINDNLLTKKSFDIFFKYYREEVKDLIFSRRTHYKILIILSVYYYAIDKKLSLFFYSLIIIVNLFALSRFEIIQLFILHSLVNLKFLDLRKNYILGIIVLLFLLIFYRYLIFLKNDLNFLTFFSNFLGDGNSTFLTNFIFYENLKDVYLSYQLKSSGFLELLIKYIKNVWYYFLNDFFYQSKITINFLSHPKFANFTYSGSPPIEFFMYLPLLFTYILVFKLIKKINFLDNKRLFNTTLLTLLLFSFRGSWIHEFGFLIKFILLMKFFIIISKANILKTYVKKNY